VIRNLSVQVRRDVGVRGVALKQSHDRAHHAVVLVTRPVGIAHHAEVVRCWGAVLMPYACATGGLECLSSDRRAEGVGNFSFPL